MKLYLQKKPIVYPACAGIDLVMSFIFANFIRLPRMRGDRPPIPISLFSMRKFTPHARGSTLLAMKQFLAEKVYPACAGIDR